MPFTGPLRLGIDPQMPQDEEASPGRYSVILASSGIRVELTATHKVGVHRIAFPENAPAGVLLDAGAIIQGYYLGPQMDSNGWEPRSIGGVMERHGSQALSGRADLVGGWGHPYPYSVHFYVEFSQPFADCRIADAGGFVSEPFAKGPRCRAALRFAGGVLEARVGISFVSVAKARAAVQREAAESFDALESRARQAWQNEFDAIRVEGGSDRDLTLVSTSLLRLLTMPSDLGVDDEFGGWHSGVRQFSDFYCLWDSVRFANSLIALFKPDLHAGFVNCLLDIGDKTGWVPDAWIAGHLAFLQGGCSSDILISEAAQRRFEGIGYKAALAQRRRGAETRSPDPYLYGRHLDHYLPHGYVAAPTPHCVSRTLEYAGQDWCIGKLAEIVGDAEIAEAYRQRSSGLWRLWKDEHKAFAPRLADGSRALPFDPELCRADCWNDPWCYEGSSRQWSFNAHHDLAGLVARHGGAAEFEAHLDAFLNIEGRPEEQPAPPPPMERMNHYRSKETMLHVPYLYHAIGKPEKSAAAVRWALDSFYNTGRFGLHDNEDMGCQSAFFMCGAMGLAPLMGQDVYMLVPPAFERVSVSLGGRGEFEIAAKGQGPAIASAKLNGQPLNRPWLRHAELAGSRLELELGEPGGWGAEPLPIPTFLGRAVGEPG